MARRKVDSLLRKHVVEVGLYSLEDGGAVVNDAVEVVGLNVGLFEELRASMAAKWGADLDND